MDLGKLAELSQRRKCRECGAVFEGDGDESALAKFSDHLVVHQPTGEQWYEAAKQIEKWKLKGKPA